MNNLASKKLRLVSGIAAATVLSGPSYAVNAPNALDQRVEAVREALFTQNVPPPPVLLELGNVVSQFNNSSSWSNWNNCNADNSCQPPG